MAPARKQPPAGTLFLVQRVVWWLGYIRSLQKVYCCRDEDDGGVALAAFSDPGRAEGHAAELTAQARRELSPFLFGYPGELDSYSDRPLAAWKRRLKAVGLKPPTKLAFPHEDGEIDWQKWYDSVAADLTDEQRQAIWDLCDRVRLYEVVEIAPQR